MPRKVSQCAKEVVPVTKDILQIWYKPFTAIRFHYFTGFLAAHDMSSTPWDQYHGPLVWDKYHESRLYIIPISSRRTGWNVRVAYDGKICKLILSLLRNWLCTSTSPVSCFVQWGIRSTSVMSKQPEGGYLWFVDTVSCVLKKGRVMIGLDI